MLPRFRYRRFRYRRICFHKWLCYWRRNLSCRRNRRGRTGGVGGGIFAGCKAFTTGGKALASGATAFTSGGSAFTNGPECSAIGPSGPAIHWRRKVRKNCRRWRRSFRYLRLRYWRLSLPRRYWRRCLPRRYWGRLLSSRNSRRSFCHRRRHICFWRRSL